MPDLDEDELKATRILNGADRIEKELMTEEEKKEFLETSKKIGYIVGTYCNKREIEIFEKILEDYKYKNNLLQKQQEEIKYWKNGFERELEDNRENTTELLRQDMELRKKDKIIDEQIDFLYELGVDRPGTVFKKLWDDGLNEEECGYCKDDNKKCTDCIKQYFERKAEEK